MPSIKVRIVHVVLVAVHCKYLCPVRVKFASSDQRRGGLLWGVWPRGGATTVTKRRECAVRRRVEAPVRHTCINSRVVVTPRAATSTMVRTVARRWKHRESVATSCNPWFYIFLQSIAILVRQASSAGNGGVDLWRAA